jgi:hypothetical protein
VWSAASSKQEGHLKSMLTTSKCDLFIASFMASEHIYEVAAEKTPQQQQLIEA